MSAERRDSVTAFDWPAYCSYRAQHSDWEAREERDSGVKCHLLIEMSLFQETG